MIIQKRTKPTSITLLPQSKFIQQDQTVKTKMLLYPEMEIDSYENNSYIDFIQPILRSYIVEITDSQTKELFNRDTSISQLDATEAFMLSLIITDSTYTPLLVPTSDIQIYFNLTDNTEVDNTDVPFAYQLSQQLELRYIQQWLQSLYVKNNKERTYYAFVTVSRHDDSDKNINIKFSS